MNKLCKYVAILAIIVSLAITLSPAVAIFAWHLAKASEQSYGPFVLTIPNSFIMWKTSQKATLLRVRFVPSIQIYSFAQIIIEVHDGAVTRTQLETWSGKAYTALLKAGYSNVKRFDVSLDDVPLECVSRQQDDVYTHIAILCTGTDNTVIQYTGDDVGVQQLMTILQDAHRTRK